MGEPVGRDYAELAAKFAALEERMNTKQAEYETGLERLGKQIAERDNARDNRLLLWIAAMFGIATAFIGLLIRL